MARRREPPVDPFVLAEPWRSYVREALQARARFAAAVAGGAELGGEGPRHERLAGMAPRVDDAIASCWRIARAADAGGLDPAAVDAAHHQLVRLTARLDEAAARAAELALGLPEPGDPSSSLLDGLEALRLALDELDAPGPGTA